MIHDAAAVVLQYLNTTTVKPVLDWSTLPALPGTAVTIEARDEFESFAPVHLGLLLVWYI